MRELTANQKAAEDLSDYVNKMGHDPKEFAKYLTKNVHRTLQQLTMSLFVACIKEWASAEFYDLRNEATISLCRKIMEKCGDDIFLPYI